MKKTRQNKSIDLIIFDCDGVLVDSEVISCRAHAETLTRHGYPITEEQVLHRFLGVSATSAQVPVFFFLAIFLATFGSILFAAIIFSPRSQPGRSRSSA